MHKQALIPIKNFHRASKSNAMSPEILDQSTAKEQETYKSRFSIVDALKPTDLQLATGLSDEKGLAFKSDQKGNLRLTEKK